MNVAIYNHASELPDLPAGGYFHSRELMELCEHTPHLQPFMVVVSDDAGHVKSHLLAVEQNRHSWLPPYLYRHVRIMGEGTYASDDAVHESPDGGHWSKNMLFSQMLSAVTRRLQKRTLYVEVSHLSQKMFGYAPLRAEGYFPVRWTSVHNSLHSRMPEERISERQMKYIKAAMRRGAITKVVETVEEFKAFSRLLHRHNWLKPRRYIPHDEFFEGMRRAGRCKLLITTFHDTVIGCSVLVYSEGDAYLWYSAARRKSYVPLHPNALTFWNSIRQAHQDGMQHIRFMDVGLPFRKNPYRDFILSFGGKEVSTFRWFRISIRWVNRLASWLWRE